ncbi:HTH-type transcriptional regulator XynR [Baekduia alba]|uniref:IclR family transcriptional regulator n=1 Tax=Baekduia alba TaxID=2997333 RepID=UPI002341F1DB|nr:IclR family transcriptional regulator [Baekduia alba]WCB92099.1 HTH-type transcriptional regulator XynR [Baekduia alba]
MRGAANPAYPIESVDRALSLILAFEDRDSITVTEASTLLDVSRSTAFRLLSVLQHRGFVRQDKRSKIFHRGPALRRVGLAAVQRSDVRAALRPLLERVVAEVDETAHLVVLQGSQAFFLDCVEGSKVVRATARLGTSFPAHLTSGGKVLLANLPPARLSDTLSGELHALTLNSKVSSGSVQRELTKVRRQGFAINDEESEAGVRAVSVLIPGAPERGIMDAAISVAGPSERLDEGRLLEIANVLASLIPA